MTTGKARDNPTTTGEQQLAAEREKKLDNLKCPTCGYQLVALDNDELAKLTEKAAYHELREHLAVAVLALKELSFDDAGCPYEWPSRESVDAVFAQAKEKHP